MGSLIQGLKQIGHSRDGQGSKWGRILRRADPDVQGLLQAHGHQQGRSFGQKRPPWRLREHDQDVRREDGWRGQRPRRPDCPGFQGLRQRGNIDSKMFEHALKTWGDKMTKAEIDDIFGEFEIDEDYMIKTKDVIGLFVAVKEEPKVEEPAPVEEAPEAEPEEDADAKKKKKKKKKAAK